MQRKTTSVPYEDPEEMERLLGHGSWEGLLELGQRETQRARREAKRKTMLLHND